MKKIIYSIVTLIVCLALNFPLEVKAQSITGTIIGNEGDPLIGVAILEKEGKAYAVSEDGGKYTIDVNDPNATLLFKFIGYKTQEIALAGKKIINLTMIEDVGAFKEVVITAQAIKRETKSLGYSSTTLDPEDLTKGGDRSLVNSMQGKVAGVNISQSSSDPGASTRIIIRGIKSTTQGNQPLFVIDGVPMTNNSSNQQDLQGNFDFGNGANAVNPEDIDNISILKGSAATALYGSRASNGVVLITTKKGNFAPKGTKRKIGVSYAANITFFQPLRLPEMQNTFGQGWDGLHRLDENGSWGPKYDNNNRVWGRVVDNSQLLKPYSASPDNLKDFFERGVGKTNHFSFNGGDATSNFYASFSNFGQDGIYPTDVDKYTRNTVALRAAKKSGIFNFSGSMNYADTKSSFVPTGQGPTVYNNIMQIPRDFSIVDMENYNAKFSSIDDYFTQYGVTNPYFSLLENGAKGSGQKFFGNAEVNAVVKDWMSILYRFGFDVENNSSKYYRAILLPNGINSGSTDDPGFVSNRIAGNKQLNHDVIASFNKRINRDLKFDGLAGLNVNQRSTNSVYGSVTGLDIPGFYNLSNSSSTPVSTEAESMRRLIGAYAQASFSYRDYLFLNLSARNDWSSTLPEDNRSFFYPSANASFVFSELLPKSSEKYLSFGKLRLGYGLTGNDAPVYVINPVYVSGSVYQPFRTFDFPLATGVNGFEVGNTIGNKSLQPEITREIEIGTDLRFLDNRISVDFTYYNRTTDNQIFSVPLSSASGYTVQYANAAEVNNKGIELLVSGKILRSKKKDGFNWNTSVNFTRNRNKVVALAAGLEKFTLGGLSTIGFWAVPGQPIGVYEGRVPETSPDGKGIVVDANGIPVAASEKEFYGNAQEKYILGLSNEFTWKGIGLSFTFDSRQGGLMFSRTADITYFTGNGIKTTDNDRKPFVVPNSVTKIDNGDGTFSYVENTVAIDADHMDDYYRADALERHNVIDRSYIKLRELALSYTVPKNFISKWPVAGIQVSAIGRNLFLWTPVDNQFIDPEVTSFGSDLASLYGEFSANPTTRSFGFSIKATF